jgi:tetratricopeptide (TPR) repeat protein
VAAIAVAAAGVAPAVASSGGGHAAQPDPRAQVASLPENSDLQRRFPHMLVDDGRKFMIDPAASADETRQTRLRRASLYETAQDYPMAESEFAAAVALGPTPALYEARGFYFMRRGSYGDAIADFLAGVRLAPDNPRMHYGVARAQAMLGNYTDAVGSYNEAIRLSPRDATFYVARAEAFIHLDQPVKARADYGTALAIKLPRTTDRYYAYLGRGYASLLMADYAGAIGDLDSALSIDPRAVNALLWRAYAREKGGQVALALDDYERAASVAPADRLVRANLQRLRSN